MLNFTHQKGNMDAMQPMIYGFGEVVTIRGWDIKKLEGDIGIKVLTQGIML